MTHCWFPSESYYCVWIYLLLLQWMSHCYSTVFLHRFSTSLCDGQMTKIFWQGPELPWPCSAWGQNQMASGGLFQPKLLCYSWILCLVPSMQQSAWWWPYHVSSWWSGSWFRAEQNNYVSEGGKQVIWISGVGREQHGELDKKLKQARGEGRAVKGYRLSTQPPSIFSFETKSWYFHPPKGTCCSILGFSPWDLVRNQLCHSGLLLVRDFSFLKFSFE